CLILNRRSNEIALSLKTQLIRLLDGGGANQADRVVGSLDCLERDRLSSERLVRIVVSPRLEVPLNRHRDLALAEGNELSTAAARLETELRLAIVLDSELEVVRIRNGRVRRDLD